MKREKSCGALVIEHCGEENRILLIQHKTGHWSFPKGHMEAGETEQMTALREVKEETSLDIELFSDFREAVSYSPARDVMKTVVYFLAHPLNHECKPQLSELRDTGWFTFSQAERLITYTNDKNIFNKMKAHVEQYGM